MSIVASATEICAGTAVAYTATPVNGGTPTYLWKKNGVSTNSAVNPFVTQYLQNGDAITVEMTSSLECVTQETVTSNSITMTVTTCPVGIDATSDAGISIYPNPASDELRIDSGNVRIEEIKIYTATGALIKSIVSDVNSIDIRSLSSGIYFLEIRFQDKIQRHRFAKI